VHTQSLPMVVEISIACARAMLTKARQVSARACVRAMLTKARQVSARACVRAMLTKARQVSARACVRAMLTKAGLNSTASHAQLAKSSEPV
jgi:hypothetical protein